MLSVFGLESESETPRSMSGRVRRHAGALIFPLCMLAFCAVRGASVAAQVTSAQTAPATSATQLKMTVLRDAFVQRVHDAGYSCKLDAPRVVVEDVPSFGNYRASDNTLRTAAWGLLTPRGRAFFAQLAGPGADEAAAHALFEATVHQWIFIHKRGHWWQACKGFTTKNVAPYQIEYGANRISLAYWREADPPVVGKAMPVFQGVVDHAPSPLPAGQPEEEYFNKNYATLGPSPAYPWFMSRMNVTAYAERPEPSFATALLSAAK